MRVADFATVILSVLTVRVAVFGPLRLGGLSIGDPWRTLFLVAVVCGLRHYLVRTPAVHQRVWNGLVHSSQTEAVRAVWPIVVVTRPAVLLVGYLAVSSIGFPEGAPPIRVSDNEALNLLLRWDTGWYLNVAIEGYQWSAATEGQQNIAFFPAYPLIAEGVANLLGAQSVFGVPLDLPPRLALERFQQFFLGSGLLVSWLAFAWGMVWLYRLAREHVDDRSAGAALLLMAAYPFAIFFSAAYTESLLLLAVVAAFYQFRHEAWISAAAWGLLAGLTRPNGCLLAGPLAVIGLRQWLAQRASGVAREQLVRHAVVAWTVAAMPLVGMLIYSGFTYSLTGDPFAWLEAHTIWGRSYAEFPSLIVPLGTQAGWGGEYASTQPIAALNAMAAVLACTLMWPVTRRLGPEYGLFMLLYVGPPLLFGGFLSVGRATSLLFPMFLYLALVLADRRRQTLVSGFACLQGLAAVLFFTWHRLL